MIGRIETSRKIPLLDPHTKSVTFAHGMAKATIISPCYALTNYHAVFGQPEQSPQQTEFPVSLSFGQIGPDEFVFKDIEGVAQFRGAVNTGRHGDDWAIVRMKKCLGKDARVGWMKLHEISEGDHRTLTFSSSSYNGSPLGRGKEYDPKCKIYGRSVLDDSALSHDCASEPGSSGGPIMLFKNGEFLLVGIHVGEINEKIQLNDPSRDNSKWRVGYENAAVDMRFLLNQVIDPRGYTVRDLIKADTLRFENEKTQAGLKAP